MPGLPNPWNVPPLRISDAGRLLGLSRSAAYRAVAAGELRTVTLDGALRVPVPEVYRLLGLDVPPPPPQRPRIV